MISGNVRDFIERLYSLQDTTFTYQDIKYWYQGYGEKGLIHLEIIEYEPYSPGYLWEANVKDIEEGIDDFFLAPIFNGKTFWEVENEIIWTDF